MVSQPPGLLSGSFYISPPTPSHQEKENSYNLGRACEPLHDERTFAEPAEPQAMMTILSADRIVMQPHLFNNLTEATFL